MSEFTKLSKDILLEKEKSNAALSRLEGGDTSKAVEAVMNDMKASSVRVSTIYKPAVDKFLSKIDQVDPISGNPRYGDKMKLRIREINEEVNTIMNMFPEAIKQAEEKYRELKSQEPEEEIRLPAVDIPISDVPEAMDEAAAEPEPAIDLEKLHQEAEAVRLRKRKRQDMKQKVRSLISFILISSINRL
jgi:hypothetical protein